MKIKKNKKGEIFNIYFSVNIMDMMNLEEVFDIFKNISSSISHKKNSETSGS